VIFARIVLTPMPKRSANSRRLKARSSLPRLRIVASLSALSRIEFIIALSTCVSLRAVHQSKRNRRALSEPLGGH
jgi:hypothetical protein